MLRPLALLSFALASLPTLASAVFINFDNVSAPCLFSQTTALTSAYSSQGVSFSGGGWEIINACGNFGVSGYSSPNFLGWNSSVGHSLTETMTFPSNASAVSIRVGASAAGTVTMRGYNAAGSQIASTSGGYGSGLGTFSLNAAGMRTVTVAMTSSHGVLDDLTFTLTPPNQAPTANAGGPYTVNQGVALTLNGSGSFDPDGSISLYQWDCTNDGSYDVSSSSATGNSCTYSAPGNYIVRLQVTDNSGATATATASVTVNNTAPTAEANGPYAVNQLQPLTLSGAGSFDPDGTISQYSWDCTSDGSYDVSSVSATGSTCTYTAPGSYIARLRVTDNNGATGFDTASVEVSNTAPVAEANGPYSVNQGTALAVSGLGSFDPDGSLVQYAWDCTNDGTYDVTAVGPTGSTCTYPGVGTFLLRLRVTDNHGATATDTAQVTVTNTAPVAEANGPYTVNQGATLPLTATGSADSDGTIVLYEWDCTNDGTYELGATSPNGSTCNYPDDGPQTVRLRVTDNNGATGTDTASVNVTNTAPLAVTNGPYTVNQGVALALVGTGSSDPDGTILEFAWDCTTDGTFDQVSPSPTGSACTYADVGVFTLTLRVTDDDGAIGAASTTVTVTNTAPVAEANGPYTGPKNSPISLTGVGSSDPDGVVSSYAWSCGNGSSVPATASPTGSTCTYGAVGSYTVTLTVIDDDGGTDTDTATVVVTNTPPTAQANGPYVGAEGLAVTLSALGSTDAGGALVLFGWDCDGDGSFEVAGAAASCVFPDDGTYTITLQVTDDDGATATATATATIANVDPALSAFVVPGGDEGVVLSFSVAGTDVPADPLTYDWSFGDGTTGSGAAATHAYDDEGSYSVTVTVTDGDGGLSTLSGTAVVGNLPPSIGALTVPTVANEGDPLTFEASPTDPGAADLANLFVSWTWGDGSSDTGGNPAGHTFLDEGNYTVGVTVDDTDGGTDAASFAVLVNNVAPTITSSPLINALQSSPYTYSPVATDPGADTLTFSLSASAPSGMTIDAATGVISWTPTYNQAVTGSFSLVLTVSDGDGGTAAQSWTITVSSADSDGDGMPDDWELDNDLDPSDPSDAPLDSDGDGLTNLEEFGLGTDPNGYDGPSVVVLIEPIGGVEVATDRPDLVLANATDPQGDVLIYDYQVFSDAAGTFFVVGISGITSDPSGQTTWKVAAPLNENQTYYWRARASDPFVSSPFSALESFIVNAVEEPPSAPILSYPVGGETATNLTPTLLLLEAVDPDGDLLDYEYVVRDAAGNELSTASGIVGDGLEAIWIVEATLSEDALYAWTARATDDTGLVGDWAAEETFFISLSNEAPFGTVFVEPQDGADVPSLSPTLVATESEDPEAGAITYEFEIATSPGFDGPSYRTASVPGTGTGFVDWGLAAAGIVLPENSLVYARVRAIDAGGVSSLPDTISFFVRGGNEAPAVPLLLLPVDEGSGTAEPLLVVEDPLDPEGDVLFLDFVVARDEELTDVLLLVEGVLVLGGGETSLNLTEALDGVVFWSARARDAFGASSLWAAPNQYTVTREATTGDDDDVDPDEPGEGCNCKPSMAGPSRSAAALALTPLLLLRRRRR